MFGSIRDARHAGSQQATAATSVIVATTATIVAGSVGCTPNSSDAISRLSANAPARPTTMPTAGEHQALLHHLREHAALVGAERHADADLAAAFGHHVRQHAVGADRGEQQRQAGEAAEQLRQQARPADRFVEDAVHVAQPDDRH